ncbi:MAG: acetyl/propionyl/methylcrotonyl-CoA carboxylase subunit alpha [Betaproteobacteria bacterium]|nr:acetyl/propionyl/methylcrotonyl-CoA carboxylase subunit alpha [Betaproteobacteria bacterium]
MFRKILIANRGEIACRVITAARDLGIRTVAVYSDADRDARHVAMADEARRIGPAPARASYLDMGAILAAAKDSGAEAIHPGYGFLSENEDFAAACAQNGIVFIGPSPEAIAAMGDKSAAKALMEKAGVPLVPGYHGENQDPAFLANQAAKIGYPVLIKASAGGGGKGMRAVEKAADFAAALEGAKREAKAAFGDERVLLERYLQRPRHIEIQVFGDARGNAVYLFERDCSVQRRHQKVLEEAPAPGMTEARRREMGEAAVAAVKAIKYTGAGTVEFIAESDTDRTGALSGRFYFMEMNTRLQVEHPVTEMITGQDLVKWQLAVAAGGPLPLAQEQLAIRGHAIEARIYAENPAKGFLPSTGTLRRLRAPQACEFSVSAGSLRIDSGVREGDAISPHYDPMIAKLVAWGETRAAALARLRAALAEYEIVGVASNVEFLGRIAACTAFAGAELDTGLIERSRAELFPAGAGAADEDLAAAALAELFAEQDHASAQARASGDPHSPWHIADGWRLNLGSHHAFVFAEGKREHRLEVHFDHGGLRLSLEGREYRLAGARDGDALRVTLGTRTFRARAFRDGAQWHVFRDGLHHMLALRDPAAVEGEDAGGGSLAAPMPGKVIQVLVRAGAKVARGAPLLVLEAMKMEHTISAPRAGVVKKILYAAGEQVSEGAELLVLEDA